MKKLKRPKEIPPNLSEFYLTNTYKPEVNDELNPQEPASIDYIIGYCKKCKKTQKYNREEAFKCLSC